MKRIEIVFRNTSIANVQLLLIDYFAWSLSPLYPLMISYEVEAVKRSGFVEGGFYRFRIELASTDEEKSGRVLAKIKIRSFNDYVVALLDNINGREDDFEKISIFVKEIIAKANQLGFDIITVSPEELFVNKTSNSEHPWEEIDDHNWDRAALKLWWEGYTHNEIALKLGSLVVPLTITNRISQLRKIYGEKIVPTNEMRRKRNLKNTS